MARREKSRKSTKSRVTRAKSAIKRTAKKVPTRLRPARQAEQKTVAPVQRPSATRGGNGKARPTRRESDIPVDVLNRTYTPKQTSLKASFRSTGEDHQRDQELAGGFADERWKDEDRFTNKSGDPRIGTHRRKYEPNE